MSAENPFEIQMQTIGATLWNPTNETLDMQYAGISISLKPGQRQVYHIKCANHLLNAFGQRGLTSLPYGADEEKIGKDAIKRNKDFKTKQVVDYNQRNENRKAMNLGYLPPTEKLKEYAIELGLKLLEPYQVRDEERAGIANANTETAALKTELESTKTQLAEMKAMMEQLLAQKKEPKPEPKSNLKVRKDGKWVTETEPDKG